MLPSLSAGLHGTHSLQLLPHLDSSEAMANAPPLQQQQPEQPEQQQQQQQALFVPTDLSGDAPPLSLAPESTAGNRGTFALGPSPPEGQHQHQQKEQQKQQRASHRAPPAKPVRAQAHRPPRAAAAAAAARASAASAAAKQPHSIVEKQRRDRINSLIDEVRDDCSVALLRDRRRHVPP